MGREVRQIQKLAPAEGLLKRLSRLYELSDEAVKEIKRLRGDLLPSALRHGGLLEALPFLAAETAKRLGIEVRITVTHWEPLAIERERELFWLIKEALNNAEKHAHARTIEIRLNQKNEIAIVEVSDDGCGFVPLDLEVAPTGLEHSGLHRLWLRMQGAGGNLHVRTGSNQGTCLRFSLPLELERIAP
jgi:two-component system NarL family sensor kinase